MKIIKSAKNAQKSHPKTPQKVRKIKKKIVSESRVTETPVFAKN